MCTRFCIPTGCRNLSQMCKFYRIQSSEKVLIINMNNVHFGKQKRKLNQDKLKISTD